MNKEKFHANKRYNLFVAFALTAALVLGGCGAQNAVSQNGEENTAEEHSVTEQPSTQPPAEKKESAYVASNEKYGLHLPNADDFGKIFKDFIYWEYATQIEKHEDKLENESNILGQLKAMKLLDGEVKIRLYYRECDKEEMDEWDSNLYNVIVGFPESEDPSEDHNYGSTWISMDYSARGLSSEYDWEYCGWLDAIQQISFDELEQNKRFQKKYTCVGETSFEVSEAEAKSYQPENKFAEGEKEHILAEIDKAVRKEYKKAKDTMLFIHDFLPGDFNLSGKEVDFNMTSEDDMPLNWIQSEIGYSGNKLEKFQGIYWRTRYSTAYSGASQPNYNPTVKFLKESAENEAEEMDTERCILVYYIKNGEVLCYNDQPLVLTEKGEILGSNDYSCLLTEKKVRERLCIPNEADIKIKYGKETYWKESFGASIVEVKVYEDGTKVAGGFFLIKDGEGGCNLMSYEAPQKKSK